MSTAELKNFLHKVIVETEDPAILSKIKEYVSSLKNNVPEWQKEITLERLEKYESGKSESRNWSEAKEGIFSK